MKKLSGAQIIIESLIAEGVDVIFGYPGGAILPTYDALLDSKIKHVLVRHEQGAAHMAEGYARVSGRPGVVMVTSGPGATNTVTGIADANMDSTPMVVISGQVPTTMIGNDAFQEADFVGITRPCTKHNYLIKDVRDVARIIKEAFYISSTGRPGPVVVDVPKDVQQAEHIFKYPERVELRGYKPTLKGNPRQIERAIEAIEKSDKPLFYVGGGVQWSGAAPELTQLARGMGIPVTETLMGLGSVPASDPLCLGMLGMHGSYGTNTAVCNTDCLMAIGARFDDRVTGTHRGLRTQRQDHHPYRYRSVVDFEERQGRHSDRWRYQVGTDRHADGGQGTRVDRQAPRGLDQMASADPPVEAREAALREWQRDRARATPSRPSTCIEEMHGLTKGDCIVATDVGQHQMWVAQLFPFEKPRSFLTSGGLGTMGYGLPAGIGAKFAAPDRKVVVVSGDGSIQMNIQELGTAVQYNVDVKVIILNNYFLGMVRQWQEKFYQERYSYSAMSVPNFVKLAEAYGSAAAFESRKRSELVAHDERSLHTRPARC